MIDSLGGPNKVNNFLATLNIPTINNSKLKKMERRAGVSIEEVANRSMSIAAKDAFSREMESIVHEESQKAEETMDILEPDLGIAVLPGASPSIRAIVESCKGAPPEYEWTDDDDDNDNKTTGYKRGPYIPRRKFRSASMITAQQKLSSARRRLASKFPSVTRTGMSCSIDTAWQKRGFDSLTSHTFFMSQAKYGKKVMKAIVKHRTCGTCRWWKRNRPGQTVRSHRCVHNHVGSARSMESASGEAGIIEMKKEGTPVEYIEGDGDNTLVARLKANQNIQMKKRFDKNHVVKNIGKHLYNIKNVKLSKTVISHLQKCVKYIFAKNQGNPDGMLENLQAVVPHQFGDHSLCHERFCGAIKNREGGKYVHQGLPYKAPLKDTTGKLREALDSVFRPVINNAFQYSDLGSSQQCEHANREVTLRAPKSLHYGNSESLDFRVQATAAFINEGRDYITQSNVNAGLSPGVHTQKYAKKCADERKRRQDKSNLPSSKRRRLILKQERCIVQGGQEVLEGISYQSGIGFQTDVDVEKLPDAIPRGDFKKIQMPDLKPTVIAVDLETTDLIRLGMFPQITQIAAKVIDDDRSFNQYVKPTEEIASGAQEVTGISMRADKMFVNGNPVVTTDIASALDKFIDWISEFENVVLIAHNGRRFDFPVLMEAVSGVKKLEKLFSVVSGFIDSLTFFRKVFPGLKSYKQETLAFELLDLAYCAHDAAADVSALCCLVLHALGKVTMKDMFDNSFSPKSVYHQNLSSKEKKKNIQSLNVLIYNGVCKRATAENIASSGINIEHLKKIYIRDGEDGLMNTFTMRNSDGQPRVTNVKRTLDTVIPKLGDFLKNLK